MTTGTIISDSTYTLSGDAPDGCGPCKVGSYYKKSWNGGDGNRNEPHSYVMALERYNVQGCSFWFPNGVGPYKGSIRQCFGAGPSSSDRPVWEPIDEYRIVSKNMEKFRKHDFNAAVNLGELGESIRMIAGTAKSLARCYTSLKRADVVGAFDAIGLKPTTSRVRDVRHDLTVGAASAWLGLTYGWRPLLGAVDDAAKAAASNIGVRSLRVRSRVRKPGPATIVMAGGVKADLSINDISTDLIWDIKEEARYSTLEEYGFLSPSLVAWELMPYSFVVDWFAPIGSYLNARATVSSLIGTYIRTTRDIWRMTTGGQVTNTGYYISGGSYNASYMTINRSVGAISSLPLPRPTLNNSIALSTMQLTSALSLLRVAFK